MHAAIEYQASHAVENRPGGPISSLTTSMKSKRRLTWKGCKKPSVNHLPYFDNEIKESALGRDNGAKGITSEKKQNNARPMSWLGSKTRSRKSVPALPSQMPDIMNTPPPRNASDGFIIPPEFTTQLHTFSPSLSSGTDCSSVTSHRTRQDSSNTELSSPSAGHVHPGATRMVRGDSVSSICSGESSEASYGAKIINPAALMARSHSEGIVRKGDTYGTLSWHHIKSTESFASLSISHPDFDARSATGSEYDAITPRASTWSQLRPGLSPAPPKRTSTRARTSSTASTSAMKNRSRARTLSQVPEALDASPDKAKPSATDRSPLSSHGKRFAVLGADSKFCLTPTFGEVEWNTSTSSGNRRGKVVDSISPATKHASRMPGRSPDLSGGLARRPSRPPKNHCRAKSLHASSVTAAATKSSPPPLPTKSKNVVHLTQEEDSSPELGLGILCP
ncbi:unnamed protein product [Sympodiomycopsis kandeliae]